MTGKDGFFGHHDTAEENRARAERQFTDQPHGGTNGHRTRQFGEEPVAEGLASIAHREFKNAISGLQQLVADIMVSGRDGNYAKLPAKEKSAVDYTIAATLYRDNARIDASNINSHTEAVHKLRKSISNAPGLAEALQRAGTSPELEC